MSGWEVRSANSEVFPCLQELSLGGCPNLVQVSVEALPSLKVLRISECGDGVLTSLVHVASSVTELRIQKISGLTDEMWRGVTEYLGAVEEINIKWCNEIRYLWESETEASKVLVKLRKLHVDNCSKLVRLGEKEGEDNCRSNLTALRSLTIWDCNGLEHCSCPDSIESLFINDCDSLTFISFSTGGQNLKSLMIWSCKKLMEKELGGGEIINSTMRLLEDVFIIGLPSLRSINELSCFIHLARLVIRECPSMESFPDHELPNLTSLTRLEIRNCPSMDASFPRGLWPPKLCSLGIGGLKKPISKWGPKNFPTSLVTLTLSGGPYEGDVRNFDQLSHLLPPSLTHLCIERFEELESVSKGLQHLTSLQHLFIVCCPKTIHLPEMLLPSLLTLRIRECPNLKERSGRGGSYWPYVSLIPYFQAE